MKALFCATRAATNSALHMASDETQWKALAHGPIEKLSDNLWRVVGALPGMPLKRVMTVARMADGRLMIHSAVAMDEGSMRELESLGEPSVMVVPSAYHRLDAPRYLARYPKLKVYCPRSGVEGVSKKVKVDGTLAEMPSDSVISASHLDGTNDLEGIVTVRSGDGVTLVVNDMLFNAEHLPGANGFVLKHITASTGGPKVSRIARLFLVKNKSAVRAQFEQMAATEGLKRVIVSHDRVISDAPADTLRAVAATL